MLMVALRPGLNNARITASAKACKAILSRIDATKQNWALENHKSDDAVPTADDLFGPGRLILVGDLQKPAPRAHESRVGLRSALNGTRLAPAGSMGN